uniref:Eudistomide n=1 Tax=Eudistoma sp. (strain FJ04-12-071) TaxID=715217 RepID=EUDIS_EUDSF
CPPLC